MPTSDFGRLTLRFLSAAAVATAIRSLRPAMTRSGLAAGLLALAALMAMAPPADAAKAKFWFGQFSFDSKRFVALGPKLNTLSVWEVANPGVRKSFTVEAKKIEKMLVALESNIVALLVQGGGEREFIIIDIETVTEVGRYVSKVNFADQLEVYALISDAGDVAFAENGQELSRLDLLTGQRTIFDPPEIADYQVLDELRGWRTGKKTLNVANWSTPRRLLEIPYGCRMRWTYVSPRSNVGAVLCNHDKMRFVDLVRGKFLAEYRTDQYVLDEANFTLTSDGLRIIHRYDDEGNYRVVDPWRGQVVGTFPMPPGPHWVEAASSSVILLRHFDENNQDVNDLRLYDLQTGALLGQLATD